MYENNNQKFVEFLKKILLKLKPRFSFHYVAYTTLFFLIIFSVVSLVSATTPNPGHPWSELGDGVFVFTNSQTTTPYTYTFPAANTTVLTTNNAVTVGQGGTGLTTIASGSVMAANAANTLSAITWASAGTKILTNTSGTISWETAASGMTWPAGGAGIPNYSGSSSWGTSYTTTGSGTVVALQTSPAFTTPSLGVATGTSLDLGTTTLFGSRAITVDTGGVLNVDIGSASGDDFTVDTSKLVVEGDTGYVGIGTTAPAVKLTLQQADQVYALPGDSGTWDMAFGIAANTAKISGMDFKNFNTAGQVRLMARNDQNDYLVVNMPGSTSSATFFGQTSNTTSTIFSQGATDTDKKLTIGTYNNGDLILGTNNTERIRILSTGNVGIGTTSPTNILSLGGTAARTIWMERNTTAATAGQGLTLSSGGAIAGTADLAGGDLTLSSGISTGTGSSAMHFLTATAGVSAVTDRTPTEKMTISGNGNVGIGMTSPGAKLDVGSPTGGSSSGIRLTQVAENVTVGLSYVPIDFIVPITGLTGQFLSTANNYSGGSTVNLLPNSIGLFSEASAGELTLGASGATGTIRFNTGGFGTANERVRIDSGGNVGIGTAAPGAKLEVNKTDVSTGAVSIFSAQSSSTSLTAHYPHFTFVNTDTTVGNYTRIGFSDSSNGADLLAGIAMKAVDHTNNYGDLMFYTRAVDGLKERLYIQSTGSVGINTTDLDGTPAVGQLTVKGSTNDGTTNILVGRDSGEANVFSINTDGLITATFSGALNGTVGATTPTTGAFTTLDASSTMESGANGGTGGQLTLYGATSGSAIIKTNVAAGSGIVFQLPSANGSNTNILQTDGAGVTSWVAIPTAMTWPAGGAGIPNYSGSSSWGTSYTTTGSGTVVALATSPAFVTSVTGGASFDVFNTTSTTINAFGAATTLTLGAGATTLTAFGTTSATTLNLGSGATTTGLTKAINLGSNGATGSTTNINIGTGLVGTGTITLGTATTGTTNIAGPFQLAGTGVTTTGTRLNYLTSAGGTTGTTSTNIVFSTSPVLTTPNIGVANGTSLDASGVLESGTNGGTGGQLTMLGATSGSVALRVNAAAGTGTIFELPATNGSNTNILQTNGSGVTSWVAAPAGSPITIVNTSNLFSTGLTGTGSGVTTATNSNFFGVDAGNGATGASYSNILGNGAGHSATTASYSNLFGFQAGKSFTDNNIGPNNIIIGTNISVPDYTENAINLGGVIFAKGTYSTLTGDPSVTAATYGKVGIGVVVPTAVLQLKAGTATAGTAPLKLTSGTALGTSEAGAIEFDNSHLWFTVTNGGTRYQLDQQPGNATLWDAIGDPSGNGSIAMGSTVQTMDWATATTTNPLSLTAAALTTAKLLSLTSNSLTSGTLLDLSSNGTGALTNQKGINVALTGANGTGAQTTYGAYLSNTHSGTSTNVGLYATATGGDTRKNYAGIFDGGQVLMGLTTVSTDAKLSISNSIGTNGSTSAIAGIHGDYTFTNGGTASYVQVGNRFVFNNTPTTNPNTMAGEIIRTIDNTTLANTVRGIEVVSNAGSNTAGTNTGIRTTGATFGLQAFTNSSGGGASVPAAIYGENTGTTTGDILRLFSDSITSSPSVATFYHNSSAFSGTGLLMDFATGSGSYSGNYLDFQNNNITVFKVTSTGITWTGLGNTASTNAVCSSLANTTAPTASVAYELRDCNAAPAADYAEMYPVEDDITYGDIVAIGNELVMTYDITDGNIDWNKEKGNVAKLVKSDKAYQSNTIGIVSNNYGDFSSTGNNIKEEDNPMPVALNGRVPVKISNSSEAVKFGDYLTTSEEPGMATKATSPGFAIGKVLEEWSPNIGKDTVMVFIEQGYYRGPESTGEVIDGLTSFGEDTEFTSNVTFNGQVEFVLPPLFNSDTAGFAVIKEGTRKVEVVFGTPYIVQPVVSTTISFEESDNMTDVETQQFFDEKINSIVTNKSQNGFTIIINKDAPRDVRFSWVALAVRDAKIFESVIPGLVIEPTAESTPNEEIEIIPEMTPTPTPEPISDTNSTDIQTSEPETTSELAPTSEPTPEIITTPESAPTPEPEIISEPATNPELTSAPESTSTADTTPTE